MRLPRSVLRRLEPANETTATALPPAEHCEAAARRDIATIVRCPEPVRHRWVILVDTPLHATQTQRRFIELTDPLHVIGEAADVVQTIESHVSSDHRHR